MKKILLTVIIVASLVLTGLSLGFSKGSSENTATAVAEADAAVIHLTEAKFKELVFNYDKNKEWKYEGNKPAIIDFYADWCAPCRQLSPVIAELAGKYSGKIIVYKVDTEKERDLAQKLGISALPTLLFIPVNGEPQVAMGALPKATLEKSINEVLLTGK
jgi:thioredoxin